MLGAGHDLVIYVAPTVHEIPDYEYEYVYANSQPVPVEPKTGRIAYVIR